VSRAGARKGRLSEALARRTGEIKRRLRHVPLIVAVVAMIGAGLLAPSVDATHSAERLQTLFGSVAGVMATLFVSLSLIQLSASKHSDWDLRFLGPPIIIWLAVGTVAGGIGAVPSLPDWIYRYLLALMAGGAFYGIVALALHGSAKFVKARANAEAERARQIMNADK
jgi:hypothetical protein